MELCAFQIFNTLGNNQLPLFGGMYNEFMLCKDHSSSSMDRHENEVLIQRKNIIVLVERLPLLLNF